MSIQKQSDCDCKCGHEIWDHKSVPDPARSGLVSQCRFAERCGCKTFDGKMIDFPEDGDRGPEGLSNLMKF